MRYQVSMLIVVMNTLQHFIKRVKINKNIRMYFYLSEMHHWRNYSLSLLRNLHVDSVSTVK